MNRYKIVYFLTRFKNAGPINQTYNLIKYLDKERFIPIVVTLFPEEANDSLLHKFKKLNIDCYCLNLSKKQVLLNNSMEMEKLFNEISPDIIHSVGTAPYKLSLNYKKSEHLITVRNYFYDDYPAKHGKITGKIMALKDTKLIKKAKNVVTCSESLSEIYKVNKNIKLPFIRNGVDLEKYGKTDERKRKFIREKLGLPQNKKIAIYTGQFLERKNQKFAIEGLISSDFKDEILLILLGDGKDLPLLKEKYSHLNNVIFPGQVESVKEYLQAADFYISTSKSEGLPNGVLEAMAVGLPILVSDIPQHREIISLNKEIGFLYRKEDFESFHNNLRKMMNVNFFRAGEFSHQVVNNKLNASCMSKEYQDMYVRALT